MMPENGGHSLFVKGSAENYRIFHLWSSGNSGNNSPSDVRICYDDWKSGCASSGAKPSWDEKAPPSIMNQQECSRQVSYGSVASGNHYGPKSGRRGPPERWPSPAPRSDMTLEKKPLSSVPQLLHPEDRCGSYQNVFSSVCSCGSSFIAICQQSLNYDDFIDNVVLGADAKVSTHYTSHIITHHHTSSHMTTTKQSLTN